MSFPQIRACLIAEDTREERYHKTTVLGMYGMTPHVEIAIQDMTKPISSITFLLFCGPGGGKYQIRPRLVSGQGEELIQAPPYEIDIVPTRSGGATLIIRILSPMIRFPREGLYKFILEVDGMQHYETTFNVRPGLPEEFR